MIQKESSISRMKKLGAYKPKFRFGFRRPASGDFVFTQILPFKKYWLAISFISVFLIAFSFPLFLMDFGFSEIEDLFDITAVLFNLFWAMGWSTAILILALILLVLLFAREAIVLESDCITLRIEIFNLGFETRNPLAYISHLRYVTDGTVTGAKWRGNHLTFDYLHIPVSFGSNLDLDSAKELISKISSTLEHPILLELNKEIEAILENQQPLPHQLKTENPTESLNIQQSTDAVNNKLSTYFLVIANLVPLAGVIIENWDIGDIMLLFWLESAIIGFFNILKMLRISGGIALFYSICFIGHFGAFMAVHLMFIFSLFIEAEGISSTLPEVLAIFKTLWLGIFALIISHGFSFKQNFINNREYLKLSLKDQMHKPYSRIMLMHVTLIFGGFLVLALDSRLLALTLLIGMKIVVDIKAHIKEHRS